MVINRDSTKNLSNGIAVAIFLTTGLNLLYHTTRIDKDNRMFQSISEAIIEKALAMYTAKNTRYLKTAQIEKNNDTINLNADFSINDCCYSAPNSGHFNAVEAIICINQMFYVTLLGGIDKEMFPFYNDKAIDDFDQYWAKVYILEFEKIKFRKLIDSASFGGELNLKPLRKVGDNMYCDCCFGFGNNKECKSFTGRVKGFMPILR